ncbi:MAG: group II truncated hemoglobin [Candidatus Methylumidiphilus sp.]
MTVAPEETDLPVLSPYQRLGGEEALRGLVARFYGLMNTLPEARGIRKMHAADLGGAADKLFKFLSGWLGGPDLFMEEYGHPRLRARHFPFPIGISERDQWMLCMDQALDQTPMDAELRELLRQALLQTATHMINQA